jgi:hypothetical protein
MMSMGKRGELTRHIPPHVDMLVHHLHSHVVGTKARLKVGNTTPVPLQSVLGREATVTQGDVLDVAFDLGVKVRVLDRLAVGAVGVDLLPDFYVGVPLHATHHNVTLELAAVVAHELLGSPVDVVGFAVGRHFCVVPMVVRWSQIWALKLSVGMWWKVLAVSRRRQQQEAILLGAVWRALTSREPIEKEIALTLGKWWRNDQLPHYP